MKLLGIAASLALLLTVAGCVPTPASEPVAATPQATRTPSPTPTAPTKVTEIVLSAVGMEFLAADGTQLANPTWFDDPHVTIGLLTDAFGQAPIEVPYAGHIEAAPGMNYNWEGGFHFLISEYEPKPPTLSNVTATATEANVEGVTIRTQAGLTAGSTPDEVATLVPATNVPFEYEGRSTTWYEADPIAVESDVDDTTGEFWIYVAIGVDLVTNDVTSISAPSWDWPY